MSGALTDRRRINGPACGTSAPVFLSSAKNQSNRTRDRPADEIRKIFLRTGLVASATGSSFLEINPLKLSVSILGPRPLPRSSSVPFTAHAILTVEVKFAPFATTVRRGYVRDSSERDLSTRLYQALVSSIRTDLYPKSRIEVVVTILDSEDEDEPEMVVRDIEHEAQEEWEKRRWDTASAAAGDVGRGRRLLGSVLTHCITASSAALADAGIELYDLVSGGMCSMVRAPASIAKHDGEDQVMTDATEGKSGDNKDRLLLLDPSAILPAGTKHLGTCVLGYMAARDEITDIWVTGKLGSNVDGELDELMDGAVKAATSARFAQNEAVAERAQFVIENIGKLEEMKKQNQVMS